MRILAIIPARRGSKRVSRKNIRLLGGKPLIAWTIDAAAIAGGILNQIQHGPYPSSPIYGDGKAGGRVADILAGEKVRVQKRIIL